jgi:integrase
VAQGQDVSIWRDKNGDYHVGIMVGGKRVHRELPKGATARDAKQLEAELRAAMARDLKPVIPGDPLISALMGDYAEHAKTLASPDTALHHAKRIYPWTERYRASDARKCAAHIVKDLTGHYAPATINRSLGTIKKALSLAWQAGKTPANYSGLIETVAPPPGRTTWLDLAEVQKLADCASEQTKAAIWIAVFTGLRRRELLTIEPQHIGQNSIEVQAANAKTRKARTIPIIASLRTWLRYLPLDLEAEGIKSGFRRAREKAGMPHVQFRDLRRSCGTLMAQHGVPLHVISKILGHSSVQVTERVYAHLANQQMHDGLAILDGLHSELHSQRKTL